MTTKLERLQAALTTALGDRVVRMVADRGQVTLQVAQDKLIETCNLLRDDASLRFSELIDLTGLDYAEYAGNWEGLRFAANYNLLSIEHNWRVRVLCFATDDSFPLLPSVIDVWPSANWYEREAFDLYGIVFEGHPDLRRILTDYGFIGHPFRKDFPISGHVEMRFDPEQGRVIYQPVTIEPREIVPRVIREDNYAGRK
jgi:NADH-quinone oxidoreductase subunit C